MKLWHKWHWTKIICRRVLLLFLSLNYQNLSKLKQIMNEKQHGNNMWSQQQQIMQKSPEFYSVLSKYTQKPLISVTVCAIHVKQTSTYFCFQKAPSKTYIYSLRLSQWNMQKVNNACLLTNEYIHTVSEWLCMSVAYCLCLLQ